MMKSTIILVALFLAVVVSHNGSTVTALLSESEIIAKEIEWMKKSLRYYQNGFGETARTMLSRDLLASYGDQLYEIPGPAPPPPRPQPPTIILPTMLTMPTMPTMPTPPPPSKRNNMIPDEDPGLTRRSLRGKTGSMSLDSRD
jgi:hypothetical protein